MSTTREAQLAILRAQRRGYNDADLNHAAHLVATSGVAALLGPLDPAG